jgi:general nucleoside transport system ATP-binding protein
VTDTGDTPRLEVSALCKHFGTVAANDDLSLRVHAGEIVVLLGENGAGKSTLLRCLAGMLQPDAGEIRVDGHPLQLKQPADALRAGIGTVYQHFALVPTFTVAEQLRLAGWRPGLVPGPGDIDIDPAATIESLSLGARQRVEIARATLSAGRVLLLDEPTSVLAPPEVEGLFATLRQLRQRGTAVVLITHKLREAIAIGDRIVVLRDGRVTGERARSATAWAEGTESALLSLMFGPERDALKLPTTTKSAPPTTSPLLRVERLRTAQTSTRMPLDALSFQLFPGEVVVIAGVDGNGQRELAEALAGFLAPTSGTIELGGRRIDGLGPAVGREAGVGFLSDDRLGEGIVPSRTVAENLALTRLDDDAFVHRGLLRRRAMRRDASKQIERFGVRPAEPEASVAMLSGGNVQKLLLARSLATQPHVLVCLKPTSGLDARTASNVHGALREFARDGRAVLLFSNEVDEALALGDRVGAMHQGRLSPLLPARETSLAALGRYMVGAA